MLLNQFEVKNEKKLTKLGLSFLILVTVSLLKMIIFVEWEECSFLFQTIKYKILYFIFSFFLLILCLF